MSLCSKTERRRAIIGVSVATFLCGTLLGDAGPRAAHARSHRRHRSDAADDGKDPVKADKRDPCLRDRTCQKLYETARQQSQSGQLDVALASYRAAFDRRKAQWLLISIGRSVPA